MFTHLKLTNFAAFATLDWPNHVAMTGRRQPQPDGLVVGGKVGKQAMNALRSADFG